MERTGLANTQTSNTREFELSILMPCLDEAETLATCIEKSHRFLDRHSIHGEIVVADNGSQDGSPAIAEALGARVVPIKERGYGAALIGGIAAARGHFVIMGDADDTYDFEHLEPFLDQLRAGCDLVMGNRFSGTIEPGAMPPLHRYLGNPALSFIGQLLFHSRIGDICCGLRGFARQRIIDLDLQAMGMEFAPEMVVRSALAGYALAEVPTNLRPDAPSRLPHLRTWSDGWRTLRFLLLLSPRWVFFYPGLVLIALGILGAIVLLPGPVNIGGVGIDIHTFIVACNVVLIGLQCMTFAIIARRYATRAGVLPPTKRSAFRWWTLERVLLTSCGLIAIGVFGVGWCFVVWASSGFGPLNYPTLLRVLVLSLTAAAAGLQLTFTAFLAAMIEIPRRQGADRRASRLREDHVALVAAKKEGGTGVG